MEFRELLRIAQRRWLTIVVFFLLGLVVAGAITYTMTPQYESQAQVYISTEVNNDPNTAVSLNLLSIQRVQSYASMADSRALMQDVISDLNLNTTPSKLAGKVSASVVQQTTIVSLTAKDEDAAEAQKLAKATSLKFVDFLTKIETPTGESVSPIKASIVSPASYNGSQVSPKPVLNMIIGAILGLVIGAAMALVRDLLDTTVSSAEDVEKTLEAPVLASIQYEADVPRHPLLTEAASHSSRVEAFRLLRTNLQFLDIDTRPRSLVITSAIPSEGKTSTATNLAIALAQTGLRVLLVDGDLRRPKVASLLGLERSVGLTTVLVGRSELQDSIQKHTDSGIFFLASGPIPPNPTEVLQSRAAQELFDRVSQMFDMVIIDGPPLLPVSDAAIMARDVDGAILVVRHAKTTKEQLRQAAVRLAQVDANLLGVTVNMTPKRGGKSYGYGYGYGYGPDKAKA